MLSSLTAATLAGLIGSPHCIGMCGGFAVACTTGPDRGAAWHAGRLATYAGLGATAGAVGAVLPGPGWVAAALSAALMVWFSLVLAGVVKEPSFRLPGVTRIATRAAAEPGTGWRFLFGMATGLLPCGLVYAALAIPVASGNPVAGAVAMVGFGLGTVPALAVVTLGVRSFALRNLAVRRLVAVGVLLAGLGSIGMRQGLVGEGAHGDHTRPDSQVESHVHDG
ncbi:MAG: sulfite exporter TauE/SafE family protein [Gemmatimonadales bacterium]|jgi:sulfite exporter TauE/SafE|nr:MAG: sulfite exporter TauE/SafE family protein [Gemmatimonadales bacterium]